MVPLRQIQTRSDSDMKRGYDAELLDLTHKKRKTAEDRERLEWYGVFKDYDPEDCDLESLQGDIDTLWQEIKAEMDD